MRVADSRAEARFRAELVAWLDEHEPGGERASDPPRSSGHIPEWATDWQRRLFDAGWLVPRWPPELGGRDASAIEQMIYLEEMSGRRLPRSTNPQGLDVCAPTLADHGTDQQRDEWVLGTLRGETSWCVAVGDGDAPASLGTGEHDLDPSRRGISIERVGDSFVVHGAIAAPAGAADADRCLCLALARPDAGIEGVAVVAVDLGAPGVERPEGADGDAGTLGADERLAFDGVVVNDADVVGAPGQGWAVVQSVRARMRSMGWITSLLSIRRALETLAEAGRSRGLADDAVFRDTLAGLHVEAESVRALAYRALAKQASDRPNPELAMLPLVTAEIEERVYLAGLEALGADGLDRGIDGPRGWPSGAWSEEWAVTMTGRAAFGGLGRERDRVASRVLGLPLR